MNDYDALGVGEYQYALFVDIAPDGIGRQQAHLKLSIWDTDAFEGYSSSQVMSPSVPIRYQVSSDHRVLQVSAKLVTGPVANYARADDIGETGVTLSLRCAN